MVSSVLSLRWVRYLDLTCGSLNIVAYIQSACQQSSMLFIVSTILLTRYEEGYWALIFLSVIGSTTSAEGDKSAKASMGARPETRCNAIIIMMTIPKTQFRPNFTVRCTLCPVLLFCFWCCVFLYYGVRMYACVHPNLVMNI